jgi:peroxiredoxin|tara:strand:- start:1681 stop:2496 length:816 start_codon:yes stop_codon:yes gene_type:complete
MVNEGDTLPVVTWNMYRRERGVNGPIGYEAAGDNRPPQTWQEFKSDELFNDRCIIIGIPGAWTVNCTHQMQMFDGQFDQLYTKCIENVYFLSVNDSFCMQSWIWAHYAIKVDWVADGNGEFTEKIGMLVDKSDCGYGKRSWRYAMVVEDNKVEKLFVEDGMADNVGVTVDPYKESHYNNIYSYLRTTGRKQDPPDDSRWYWDVPSAEKVTRPEDDIGFKERLKLTARERVEHNQENADFINFDPSRDSIAHKEKEEQDKKDKEMEGGMLGT